MEGTGAPDINQPTNYLEIGRQFVKQYYTMLSEHPEEAFRYYGNESILNHNGGWATGPLNIQKAIDELNFHDSKFKIFSVKGAPSLASGVALQVIGEIHINTEKRKFSQTFVLGQQGAKKFYIFNDIFMYSDKVYEADADTQQTVSAPEINNLKLNGHGPDKHQKFTKEDHLESANESDNVEDTASHVKLIPKEFVKKEEEPKSTPEKQKLEPPCDPSPPKAPASNEPKTWAKLFDGSSSKPAQNYQPKPQTPAGHAPPQREARPPSSPKEHHQSQDQGAGSRKIYISNIVIKNEKANTNDIQNAADELKKHFSSFGIVETINIPHKVLDLPDNKPAYAFLTMQNLKDAQKILSSAQEDSKGHKCVTVSIPSFQFEGEVTVVYQSSKYENNAPSNGNYNNRGYQPTRGGYQQRGAFRGGARGGFRSANQHPR